MNAFVDLLDMEDKKQDLLASWKGFVIEVRSSRNPSCSTVLNIPFLFSNAGSSQISFQQRQAPDMQQLRQVES
jgi:hypothetical protein